MKKPNSGEIYMYINLFWLAVGVYVFVPILNNFFLQLIILFTNGNILYGSLSANVSTVRDIIGAIANYLGLGILAVCVINFGKFAKGVTILAFSSHIVIMAASLMTYALYGGDDINTAFLMLSVDMLVNMLIYAVIYLVLYRLMKKRNTFLNVPCYRLRVISFAHPLSLAFFLTALIYGIANIAATLYSMIGDFLDPSLGPPVNIADTLYWVLEYLSNIVSVLIGYFIMLFVGVVAEKWKTGVEKRKFQ